MFKFFTDLFGLHSPFSQTDAPDHMVESRVQRV